jgi:hypothetical protein
MGFLGHLVIQRIAERVGEAICIHKNMILYDASDLLKNYASSYCGSICRNR